MATLRTVTVKPDGTGDYTTIANALAGEGKDLVALDRQLDVVVGAGIYTDPISDAGFVQDATRFLRIIAAAGAEATAVWRDSGVASIQPGNPATTAVTLSNAFTRIERMQVSNDGSTSTSNAVSLSNGATAQRIFGRLRNVGGVVFKLASGSLAQNCVGWGGTYAFDVNASTLYNCSASGATNGTRGISSPVARNVVAYGNGADWTGNTNNWVNPSSNIAGSTATFPRSPYIQLTASPWTSPATGDFTLVAGCPLVDAGADLSSAGVTTDIAGTARPQGSAYDIGASEYVVSAVTEILATASGILPVLLSGGMAALLALATGAGSLSALSGTGATALQDDAQGVESLPMLRASGASGPIAEATGLETLPALEASGTFDAAIGASSTKAVPALGGTGTGTTGVSGQGNEILPSLHGAGEVGGIVTIPSHADSTLPMLVSSSYAETLNTGRATIVFPMFQGTGVVPIEALSHGSQDLPALYGLATVQVEVGGFGTGIMPMLSVFARIFNGTPTPLNYLTRHTTLARRVTFIAKI